MNKVQVGILSYSDMQARTMAIARGELRPSKDDPKVWFPSLESLAKILSDQNKHLLELIDSEKPNSLAELEAISGRAKSNLSRTLKTMEKYGLVKLDKGRNGTVVPRVTYRTIKFDVSVLRSA